MCAPDGREADPPAGRNPAGIAAVACLGNVAEITMLSPFSDVGAAGARVSVGSCPSGLVERQEGSSSSSTTCARSRVLTDPENYAPRPSADRPGCSPRTRRREKREEAIFRSSNQLNRGAALINSRDEREQLAELNLIAAKRAKAATAYASR